MPKFFRLYFILVVFTLNKVIAQDHGFFNQVWLEEGLSQSSISSIVQDKKGLMWFGTQDGLNRYDGRLIEHYNFKPFDSKSISGDDITGFCIKDNKLYVISSGGLDVMDLNNQSVVHYKEIIKEKEKPAIISRIWNINGIIYLNTNKGFTKLTESNNSFKIEPIHFKEKEKSELRTNVYSLCYSGNNSIYAATNKGLFVMDYGKTEFSPVFDINTLVKTDANSAIDCQTILFKNNKIYFSIAQSFYVLDIPTSHIKMIPLPSFAPSIINHSYIDNLGKIWLGTNGAGLFRLSGTLKDSIYLEKSFNKNSNEQFGLKSNDISSIYQNTISNSDIVWIGTRDAGVFNYSYSKNSFDLASSILKSNEPNYFGIVKDKDGVIWSGFNYGILKLDRKNKSFYLINLTGQLSKIQRFIEAIYCDDENTVWTGFGNSLYKIDKKNNTLIPVLENIYPGKRNQVFRILKYSDSEILLCNTQGVLIYNIKNGATEYRNEADVNGEKVKIEGSNSFFIDSKKNWWIGSARGLLYINNTTGKGKYFTHVVDDTNSLVSSRIMDINETKTGDIAVATTKGLSILNNPDGQTKFRNYHNVKGLSNNFIYGLLRDDKGNFWMSTNLGISVYNPDKNEFKSYSASDGVCINEFNSAGFHKSFDGELLFGGIGGLVSIYPNKQIINKVVPNVFLKSLKIENYNDSITINLNSLELDYNQNKINFEFVVPDFQGADNINLFYRFKPSGKWTKINPSKVFSLTFAKLAPGSYNLEIKAVNSEGIESKPLAYSFTINPPFWNTWWFFVLIIVGIILASWGIYRIRLHNKIEHIKEVERVRKEENEKVRKAAALDLHDEFGNGLTRISMLIEMARIHIPKENKEANGILDVISQNSQRLYQGTKDFIWSINPGNDNLYEIIIRVKDFGDELFYGTGCTFEVEGLNDELKNIKQLPSAGRNITMIFKEALSNIVKHSKANKVNLTITPNGSSIYVKLKDNGIGFEEKAGKNSFGLSNMQQRASRASANINIRSEKNNGTEITLSIQKSLNTISHEN
ncbi:MAG: hypothetical protein J0L69_16830 [Bacteroidetes bacterium]|nr:hypothetical protein [Bacteroidota bacterium]